MKNIKGFYIENYKTYWEKWKLKWRNIPCSQTERLNIIKMAMRQKFTYKFNAILIKIKEKFSPKLESLF